MKITFPDGSFLEYYYSVDIATEYLDNENSLARRAWLDWSTLLTDTEQKTYKFKNFLGSADVEPRNPLFFRMFIEDNFSLVKFDGDLVQEIPEEYSPLGFIVE
jgi:hypothetical protein